MKKGTDMTVGSPFRLILLFTIPIIFNNLFNQLYSLADSAIVALALGNEAVTGVNLSSPFLGLILGFTNGCVAGFGVVMSQFFGKKDEDQMRKSFFTSLVLTACFGIAISCIAIPFTPKILKLLNTNELYINYSVSYARTILTGNVCTMFSLLATQYLLALGDSRSVLPILLTSAILNVALNSLLFLFDWGVAWTAWATIIAQATAAIVGFATLLKKFPALRLKKTDCKFFGGIVLKNLATALPMGIQFSFTSLGCMIQQRTFNSLPPEYAMGQTTGDRVLAIFIGGVFNAFGTAIATYMGQNYGAQNADRLKAGLRAGFAVGGIMTAISFLGTLLITPLMSRILLPKAAAAVYRHVFTYALYHALSFGFLLLICFSRNALQAVSKSIFATFGGAVELIAKFIFAFSLKNPTYTLACLSNPIAWCPTGIFLTVAFLLFIKKVYFPFADKPKAIDSEPQTIE